MPEDACKPCLGFTCPNCAQHDSLDCDDGFSRSSALFKKDQKKIYVHGRPPCKSRRLDHSSSDEVDLRERIKAIRGLAVPRNSVRSNGFSPEWLRHYVWAPWKPNWSAPVVLMRFWVDKGFEPTTTATKKLATFRQGGGAPKNTHRARRAAPRGFTTAQELREVLEKNACEGLLLSAAEHG